jgi:sulfatase modifying factor 1
MLRWPDPRSSHGSRVRNALLRTVLACLLWFTACQGNEVSFDSLDRTVEDSVLDSHGAADDDGTALAGDDDTRDLDLGSSADDVQKPLCVPRCASLDLSTDGSGPCGTDGCGGYCGPCAVVLADSHAEQRWALCDEATHTCAPPQADCHDGWCRIPARSFIMGDALEPGYSGGWPRHPVVLSRSFEVMTTEVTRSDWFALMPSSRDPSPHAACGSTCPINGMTFFDALEYANQRSKAGGLAECYELLGCAIDPTHNTLDCELARFDGPDCSGYRLPSEAEWELAAGAGVNTCLPNAPAEPMVEGCWSHYQHEVGWYCGNSHSEYEGCSDCSWRAFGVTCCAPQPVAQLQPNRFGLYDTSGNVMELTTTIFEQGYARGLMLDPGFDPIVTSNDVVVGGGGWFAAGSAFCCGWSRGPAGVGTDGENWKLGARGFRLVRTLPTNGR